ncbi:hypothetical protein NMY22_g8056 [Coprinellus aureogranulatus]|nr:hypothetical protein NMY22_g8056 [Coprinellus aureogranulatus]
MAGLQWTLVREVGQCKVLASGIIEVELDPTTTVHLPGGYVRRNCMVGDAVEALTTAATVKGYITKMTQDNRVTVTKFSSRGPLEVGILDVTFDTHYAQTSFLLPQPPRERNSNPTSHAPDPCRSNTELRQHMLKEWTVYVQMVAGRNARHRIFNPNTLQRYFSNYLYNQVIFGNVTQDDLSMFVSLFIKGLDKWVSLEDDLAVVTKEILGQTITFKGRGGGPQAFNHVHHQPSTIANTAQHNILLAPFMQMEPHHSYILKMPVPLDCTTVSYAADIKQHALCSVLASLSPHLCFSIDRSCVTPSPRGKFASLLHSSMMSTANNSQVCKQLSTIFNDFIEMMVARHAYRGQACLPMDEMVKLYSPAFPFAFISLVFGRFLNFMATCVACQGGARPRLDELLTAYEEASIAITREEFRGYMAIFFDMLKQRGDIGEELVGTVAIRVIECLSANHFQDC